MNYVRTFHGFGPAARFLEKQTAQVVPVTALAMGLIANTLHARTRKGFGDRALAPLTQTTMDDRVAKGYTADEPLLRDGALLRDSVEMEVGPDFAAVGSSEPVMAYSEFGAYNHWAKKVTPPRPVFRTALEMALPGLHRLLEELAGVILGITPFTTVSRTAAQSMAAQPSLPGLNPPIAGYTSEIQ